MPPNVNIHSGGRAVALGELSRARVVLSEFKYNRGAKIYRQGDPVDKHD